MRLWRWFQRPTSGPIDRVGPATIYNPRPRWVDAPTQELPVIPAEPQPRRGAT
jgi:hypothetical protein